MWCFVMQRSPEISSHIETLMVAIQHVDCTTLHPRLPVQLPQQEN